MEIVKGFDPKLSIKPRMTVSGNPEKPGIKRFGPDQVTTGRQTERNTIAAAVKNLPVRSILDLH